MTKKGTKQRSRTPRGVGGQDVDLGKRIRIRRTEINVTQDELGQMLGISFQQIQKYEKGVNRVSVARLSEIAKALQVPISYFYDEQSKSSIEVESIIYSDPRFSLRLLRAYAELPNDLQRRQIVHLMESMANIDPSAQ